MATVNGTTSTFINGVWSASGPITNINSLLASVQFDPAANFAQSFTIASLVSDGTNSITGSKQVTVTSVNDAPVVTGQNAAESFIEDGLNFTLKPMTISDVDSTTVTATLTLSNILQVR